MSRSVRFPLNSADALTDMILFQAGQVISGLGAGLNELIALAGTSEMVPKRKRGAYGTLFAHV